MGDIAFSCPVSRECGGCELLATPYPVQLERKTRAMERLYEPVCRACGVSVEPVLGMDEPRGYRYKAATPLAPGKRHSVRCGFYARGTHEIVRCPECAVEAPGARQMLNRVAYAIERLRIPAYDEDRHTGVARHAVLRMAYRTEEATLTLVTNGPELPRTGELLERLLGIEAEGRRITTVAQNVNEKRTNAVLGGRTKVLWGPPRMTDRLLGCTFEISPTAFYQTNPAQTEVLYGHAVEGAALRDGDRVLDAYCGSGTIGLAAADRARAEGADVELVGVERNAAGIADARRNAELNGLGDRARFVSEDATRFIGKAAREGERFDVLVLDPPRAGATEAFLSGALALAPGRIVYVSCNPRTHVRDLGVLVRGGYTVERIAPVDMFPHTRHCEVVAVLARR